MFAQVSSNKMLRQMRKKDRRKAARAGKGSANLPPSDPPVPGHEIPPNASSPREPGNAPTDNTSAHSTADVKVRVLQASLLLLCFRRDTLGCMISDS